MVVFYLKTSFRTASCYIFALEPGYQNKVNESELRILKHIILIITNKMSPKKFLFVN